MRLAVRIAVPLTALALVAGVLVGADASHTATSFDGTDTTTRGNWSHGPSASRTFNYGTFAYMLPNSPGPQEYEVGGDLTTQPSLDETGGPGFGAADPVSYRVHGPTRPQRTEALLKPDGKQRRAAACFGPQKVTTQFKLPKGKHRIAVYLVDYDRTGRMQSTVTDSNGSKAQVETTNTTLGVYHLFAVNSNGTAPISIVTTATSGANAVMSGVFVDPYVGDVSSVRALGVETATHGNWIGKYGQTAYLLCGMRAPATGSVRPWAAGEDVSSNLAGYTVTGDVYAWTGDFPAGPVVGPAYAFAWTGWQPQGTGDPRFATFWKKDPRTGGPPAPGDRRATAWDSGDDVAGGSGADPLTVDLRVPVNSAPGKDGFRVSFYFLDFDGGRAQDFRLEDLTRGAVVHSGRLASFGGGVYHRYVVPASTNLRLTLTKAVGVNSVLSGIFVDELARDPGTPGGECDDGASAGDGDDDGSSGDDDDDGRVSAGGDDDDDGSSGDDDDDGQVSSGGDDDDEGSSGGDDDDEGDGSGACAPPCDTSGSASSGDDDDDDGSSGDDDDGSSCGCAGGGDDDDDGAPDAVGDDDDDCDD